MKILICPLNWGLGHATRCVPLIQNYIALGYEVKVVSDGYPLKFLQLQFPQLQYIEFKSYKIVYSKGKSQIFVMLKCIPAIFRGIIKEHKWLGKLLKTEHFDMVISDNRFGMWSKQTHSVYITHQLMIKLPYLIKWLEPVVWLLHRLIINQYDECFIPDVQGKDSLSVDLSQKYPLPSNARFIGYLSRFSNIANVYPDTNYDVMAVISGPEPQRTIFENFIINRYKDTNEHILVVCGKPNLTHSKSKCGNITLVSHLNDTEFASIALGVKKIISRSGYTSIMDYKVLKCIEKVEFIPTPGQTEQEYLFTIQKPKY